MSRACTQENCTVAETGVCLLSFEPGACPSRGLQEAPENEPYTSIDLAPPLVEPEQRPRFPLSFTMTSEQTREMMGQRYCRLIGILGAPDAGKTAALVSFYLLVSRGRLKGFSYADSRSLMAFDEISHGARRWNDGELPDQLTAHTDLGEDRSAGFLHIRLKPSDSDAAVDLLLPDIPGEWTTAMVDNRRIDRLEFLHRADVIWLMVDGQNLTDSATRRYAVHRTKMLLQRIAEYVKPSPPVMLVITRHDLGPPPATAIKNLRAEAESLGITLEVSYIASFADPDTMEPGAGIAELISASIRPVISSPSFWPAASRPPTGNRFMMRFQNRETE